MNFSKLFALVIATIPLGGAALASPALAQSDRVTSTAGGVPYVFGGVGTTSAERLNSLAMDFNLKLVFALKAGDYLSGVEVAISDASGKTFLETRSDGPWLLTRLPPGNYQIVASFAGKAERRSVAIGAEKLQTVDFRWASEVTN